RLVVVPAAFTLDDNDGASLGRYVTCGGHPLVSYATGLVDGNSAAHPGGAPGPIRDLLGLRVEEVNPLQPGTQIPVHDYAGITGRASIWQDIIRPDGATVVARYADGPWTGTPAVTVNTHGSGTATYIGATLSEPLAGHVLDQTCQRAGIEIHPTPHM